MIAVADTSPLCYLVLIGEIELLSKLFTKVLVPSPVIGELRHADAPTAVRNGVFKPSSWIELQNAQIGGESRSRSCRLANRPQYVWQNRSKPISSFWMKSLRAWWRYGAVCESPAHWECSAKALHEDWLTFLSHSIDSPKLTSVVPGHCSRQPSTLIALADSARQSCHENLRRCVSRTRNKPSIVQQKLIVSR